MHLRINIKEVITCNFFTACESAHYGPNCSMECSVNCLNNTCNSSNGSCMYGYQEGFYGEECGRDSDSCFTQCDRKTGQCIGECPEGRFGEFCNKTCSEDCKNNCNKTTGSCEEGCVLGNFGDFCNKTCDAQCLSSCDQKTENSKHKHVCLKMDFSKLEHILIFLHCWMLTTNDVSVLQLNRCRIHAQKTFPF